MSQPTSADTAAIAAMFEHLIRIEATLADLLERMARIERAAAQRHQVADRRAERIDRYVLDDAFMVDATNKQLISAFNGLRSEVQQILNDIRREHHQTRTALELQLSAEGLARERGRA